MVDAIQAIGKIPIKPKGLGISLMSFSGHKIYALKGIGGFYKDRLIKLVPLIHVGDQEMGLRAGTENVGYILSLGQAFNLAYSEMKEESERIKVLRGFFS